MAASDVLFSHHTREAIGTVSGEALAVIPVGATEQHGPHLPVGTDALAVEHVARAAALAVGDQFPVLVTPTLPFGSSHHHLPFGGTMSLRTETYYRVVYDLVESLIVGGFRRVFVLNGHGGNQELIGLVVRDLALRYRVALAAASYWDIARESLSAGTADPIVRPPGHAGAFETSLVMALQPELVREPRPHRDPDAPELLQDASPVRREYHGSWGRIDGYTDSPDQATAERGRSYLHAIISGVSQAFVEFYRESESKTAIPPDRVEDSGTFRGRMPS